MPPGFSFCCIFTLVEIHFMISLAIHIFSIGGVSLILETERLYLRKLNKDDFSNLCSILQDAQVMYAYEHAFSDDEVSEWLCRQLSRYEKDGFGLWAVILKETGEFIGQCGITMQDCNGTEVPEIGCPGIRSGLFHHPRFQRSVQKGCAKKWHAQNRHAAKALLWYRYAA